MSQRNAYLIDGELLHPARFAHDPLDAEVQRTVARRCRHVDSERRAVVDEGPDVDPGPARGAAACETQGVAQRRLEHVSGETPGRYVRHGPQSRIDAGLRWHG